MLALIGDIHLRQLTLRLPRDYGWATSIADLAAIENGVNP
jgi:hypothetical protein